MPTRGACMQQLRQVEGVRWMRKIVVGVTGATGATLAVELLRRLEQCPEVETHLALSRWARVTVRLETRMGARIVPPMPAFYNHPACVGDIADHIVTRILDQFDVESPTARRWNGVSDAKAASLEAVHN
jgi:3-polyprenyl-4-hydroxybenzoate decarboxylase